MDVISTLGYTGQKVIYLNDENLLYVTGNGAVVVDLVKGPKDIMWRMDKGISTCLSHVESKRLVIAPNVIGSSLEIVDASGTKQSPRAAIMLLENPSMAKIISLSFSRNGNRLIGLSDTLDQRIICWDVDSGTMLFSSKTSHNMKSCSINPTDDDVIIMHGDNDILKCTVSEVLGEYSVKMEPIILNNEKISSFSGQDTNYTIKFATWVSSTSFMVGTSTGLILDVNITSKLSEVAIKLTGSFPTCAVITIESLIVGTSDGNLLWFRLMDIDEFTSKGGTINELVMPCQSGKVEGSITSLVLSPTFENIHIGSSSGDISQFSVEIKESKTTDEDDAGVNYGDDDVIKKNDNIVNLVTPLRSFTNHNNIAICTASLRIPIQSGVGKAKSNKKAAVFVTASYSGSLTFWQVPPVESAISAGSNSVRSFDPKPMKILSKVNIDLVDRSTICSLDSFRPEGKGNIILFVGMTSGWLEIWNIMAKETEDEEEEEEEEEESGKIKLTSKRIGRKRICSNALSIMSISEDATKMCVSSHFENIVYVLSLVAGNEFPVILHFSLAAAPVGAVWTKTTQQLWVVCNNGNIYSISPESAKSSLLKIAEKGIFEVFPETCMTAGVQILCANGDVNDKLYLTSETGSMLKIVLPAILDDAASNLQLEESKVIPLSCELVDCCLEHSDVPIISSFSPSGKYWATGCADGTVCIWTQDCELVSKVRLHSDSIIGLSFSKNASVLLSCSADGSIFMYGIENSVQLPDPKKTSTEKETPINVAAISSDNTNPSWAVLRKKQLHDDLKGSYASSAKELKNFVQDISTRLQELLDKNEQASELEKLDRFEFVVDVDNKTALIQANAADVEKLRNKYIDRNYLNELVSGRIKKSCWDTLESKQSTLQPFSSSDGLLAMQSVSSFSVQKLAEEEALLLEKVKRLRSIEIRSQRAHQKGIVQRLSGGMHRSSWASALVGFPVSISWINNDGTRWPSKSFIETLKLEKEQEGKEKSDKKEKDEVVAEGEEEENASMEVGEDLFDEKDILNMLYPPQCVRTQVQKRTQLILMKEIVRMMRSKFNEEFESLRREKDDVIASIESRNARLQEILSELQQTEELFVPKLANVEIVGSAIIIKDDEIASRPYESDAARAIRLKEEEDKRRKEAEKNKNDVKGRALDEMMHGTLEIKRDVFAEASALHRPKWMDEIPVAEMNEDQLKELDAFETKFKEAQEEMAKYRKVLEQEFKKLKLEISDVCKAFDEKLANLAKLKVVVQKENLSQELYMTKIATNMTWRDKSWKTLKQVENEIEETRKNRATFRVTLEKFTASVEETKKNLESMQEEERNLDKTFKRDLQTRCNATFDQDSLKIFNQLYRQRTYPHVEDDADAEAEESEVVGGDASQMISKAMGASGMGTSGMGRSSSNAKNSAMGRSKNQTKNSVGAQSKRQKMKESKGASRGGAMALGPMQAAALALKQADEEEVTSFDNDPFYSAILQKEKMKKIKEAQIPISNLLSLDIDCPEGFNLDQFTWAQLQELRTARISKEIESKKLELQYNEAANKLSQLSSEDAILVNNINSLRASRDELITYLQNLENDIEIIVNARQGQDEVDKDAVLTNYDEAILMPISIVGKFNFRVKELGSEKIGVLGRKKEFRRKINTIDWDAKHLSLEAKHLEEYFTDLQLMRVTRELQEVIREGSNDSLAKERLDKISSRKEFIMKDADARLEKMRKVNADMRRQLSDRGLEIATLENKIQDLRIQVSERENVKKTRDNARGAASNPVSRAAQKMKKVVKRRHLVDTARAQAEEIDFLRQELDRMRQKTFPSFVRTKKN